MLQTNKLSDCEFKRTENPSLVLECDSKIVLLIDINPNMTDHTETVFVNDGASCTINIANKSLEELVWATIWYANLTIFARHSLEHGTKICDINSGEQENSPFLLISRCMIEKLSPYYNGIANI